MLLPWLKVFKLTGIVFWMGSLLILTRVVAYRAAQTSTEVRDSLRALERKLFMGGVLPGLLLSLIFGTWILVELDWGPLIAKVSGAGFHIKLTFVFLLIGLTFWIKSMLGADEPKPGTWKMLHGVVALLFIAALVSVIILYPKLREKKRQDAAQSQDEAALVVPYTKAGSR